MPPKAPSAAELLGRATAAKKADDLRKKAQSKADADARAALAWADAAARLNPNIEATRYRLPGPIAAPAAPVPPPRYREIEANEDLIRPFSIPSCPSSIAPFILFLHQLNSSIYFNSHDQSVLCWHGLGSGKTLTSIAATLVDTRHVVVFAPASLIPNFIGELTKFSQDILYFLRLPNAAQAIDIANKFLLYAKSERHRFPNITDTGLKELVMLIIDTLGNEIAPRRIYHTINDIKMNDMLTDLNSNAAGVVDAPIQQAIIRRGGKKTRCKIKNKKTHVKRRVLKKTLRKRYKNKKTLMKGGHLPFTLNNAIGNMCTYHFCTTNGALNTPGYIEANIYPLCIGKSAFIMDESQLQMSQFHKLQFYDYRFIAKPKNPLKRGTPQLDVAHINYTSFEEKCKGHPSFAQGFDPSIKAQGVYMDLIHRRADIKIILLSATPIVKNPNDFAITLNILKGEHQLNEHMPYNTDIFEHNYGIIMTGGNLIYDYNQSNEDRQAQFANYVALRIRNEQEFNRLCAGYISLFKNVVELMPTVITYASMKHVIGNNGSVFLNCEECIMNELQISKMRYNHFVISKYSYASTQKTAMKDITHLMNYCPTARVVDTRFSRNGQYTTRADDLVACRSLLTDINAYFSTPHYKLNFNNLANLHLENPNVVGRVDIHEIHKMSEIVVDRLAEKIANVNAMIAAATAAAPGPYIAGLNLDLNKYQSQLENSETHLRYAQIARHYALGDTVGILEELAKIEANGIIDHFSTTHMGFQVELQGLRDRYKENSVNVIKKRIRSIDLPASNGSIANGLAIMVNAIAEVTLGTRATNPDIDRIFAGSAFTLPPPTVNNFLLTDLSIYNPKLNALMCNLFSERITNLNTHTKHIIYVTTKSVAVLLGRILNSIGYGEISDCNPDHTLNDLTLTNLSYFAYLRGEILTTKDNDETEITFGDTTEGQSTDKSTMINLFNKDPTGKFNILIINDSVAEGITLRNVNKVHLYSQPPDLSKAQQIVARANRTCTHPDGGQITPYLYLNKLNIEYNITFDEKEAKAIYNGLFPEWTNYVDPAVAVTQDENDAKAMKVKTEITDKDIFDLTDTIRNNDRLLPYLRVIEESAIENEP